ncbi:MAG TPA: sigma-70 family RNA polymerase sigma factor [Streptosporangiaceae bacterium]|nr:sigma-70 family RNA polymerase sigma factor [Streptosporangiaceae bacterium]
MTDDAAERFELLYRQHFRAVLHYALARLEPENARDAAAETFLIAWRRLSDVPDDPRSWLFGVARKVVAGQCRSGSRREALRTRLAGAGAGRPGSGEVGERVAERALVMTAFAQLSENDREALRLIAWDGLTSKAAADVLGVTRFAFGVRLHRARRRLSAALAAAEPADEASPPPVRSVDREEPATRWDAVPLAHQGEVR